MNIANQFKDTTSVLIGNRITALDILDEEPQLNLGRIAFENHHVQVFHAWLNVDATQKFKLLTDRYVFYSVCHSFEKHVAELQSVDFEKPGAFVQFINELVFRLVELPVPFSEEWFKGINLLVEGQSQLHYIREARQLVAVSLRTGVSKYPGIAQSTVAHAAYLDALIGRKDKAAKTALKILQKPYLLPNRRELPKIYHKLMYILAASNQRAEYRHVIWRGASNIYADRALRDTFVGQISKTYRGGFRAAIATDAPIVLRVSFLLGFFAKWVATLPILSRIKADLPIRLLHLGWIVLLGLSRLRAVASKPGQTRTRKFRIGIVLTSRGLGKKPKKILVTRAMGGIGDLLMMTPGLMALRHRYKEAEIEFAVPKSFHSLLEGLPNITLRDINDEGIDVSEYDRWINLTDCPAGKAESRQYPNVKANRIESFAKAMGISKRYLRNTNGFIPYYRVTEDEVNWAASYLKTLNPNGLPVVGMQPFSVDSYKNWPYMEELALELAKNNCVLIFHHESILGFDKQNIHKILVPIRKSVALLTFAKHLIAVDSSFVHISAALGIRTTAIFGPTSGEVFSRYYPNVTYVGPKKEDYPCYPCWRNEHKQCHLTNGRESICLRSIGVGKVTDLFLSSESYKVSHPVRAAINWVRYGGE